MKSKSKKKKKKTVKAPLIIVCIISACALLLVISISINAQTIGSSFGSGIGTLAGRAIGSLEGMTEGRREGTEEGKREGLSAKDTQADIANELKEIQQLEVLVASVKLKNIHKIGEENKEDYAALYIVNGQVIFTVDMGEAVIEESGDTLNVTLPVPEGKLVIDDRTIEKLDDYQKRFFSGSAEDGYDAYLNTMKELQKATADTLDNYDQLIDAAKEAATEQVTVLAQSVSLSDKKINITFME